MVRQRRGEIVDISSQTLRSQAVDMVNARLRFVNGGGTAV